MKKTLVIGASENSERYSNKAIKLLVSLGYEVVAIGAKPGTASGIKFEKEMVPYENIDTVTLYINPKIQEPFYNYIISLMPKRVLFNPGTENAIFEKLLKDNNIETMQACTLVLLNTGQY